MAGEAADDGGGEPDARDRWRPLLDAVVSLCADLPLDDLLRRIVEVAADLSRCRYAALWVPAEDGDRRLGRFVTHGMSREQVERIDHPPRGHGLLGHLIDRPGVVRLHDIAVHPASWGFPEHHPPMRSFLGVPVRVHDEVVGNLYLTEKQGGADFTSHDEEIVSALAAAAGVAIVNARLHEKAAHRERWLSAAAEVTRLLLEPGADEGALQVIADRARELAGADVAWVVAGPDDAHLAVQLVSGLTATPEAIARVDLSRSLARHVVVTGVPVTVDDLVQDERALDVAEPLGWPALGPAVVVPLRGSEEEKGVVGLAWLRGTPREQASIDPSLPTMFAEQAALALHLAQARRDQQDLLLLHDRDRIARDLHDLVIQRLFAVGLTLQGAARLPDRDRAAERLDQAVDELDLTIREIRRAIFALGTVEASSDVREAVTRVVERAGRAMAARPALRFEGAVRSRIDLDLVPDVVAVLTEALSNTTRHAGATTFAVELSVVDGVRLSVGDDGCGMPEEVTESGLANLRQRAERRGGRLTLGAGPGGRGTELVWWVPHRSSPDDEHGGAAQPA